MNEKFGKIAGEEAYSTYPDILKDDRRRAVFTLQKWLLSVSNAGMPIPHIVPDGIYGKKTEEAVFAYQGIRGIAQTGQVDYETWCSLEAAGKQAKRKCACSCPIYPFEYTLRDGVLMERDRSPLVRIVQIIIEALTPEYPDFLFEEPNGEYGKITAENVKIFQRARQLPQTGNVDKTTWNLLAEAYNCILNAE